MVRPEGRTLTQEQAQQLLGDAERAPTRVALSTDALDGHAQRRGARTQVGRPQSRKRRRASKAESQARRRSIVTADTKTLKSRRAVNFPNPVLEALLKKIENCRRRRERIRRGMDRRRISCSRHPSERPLIRETFIESSAQICERAGLGHWHPHELRHSAASLMLASGVKLQVVSEVLGHSSIRMTADVYGHILDPDRQQAASAMSEVLWGEWSGGAG